MKNCFVATLGPSKDFPAVLERLKNLMQPKVALDFSVESLSSLSTSVETFATQAVPHLLLVDPQDFKDKVEEKKLHAFFSGLRRLDPAVCIVVLWPDRPSAVDLMTWLDQGATGLLNPTIQNPETDAALIEALEQRVSTHLAREPRAAAKHSVRLQVASLEQAMAAETLNLGFGGMFLRISPRDIRPGDEVDFHLEFSSTVGARGIDPALANPLVAKMEETTSIGIDAELKSIEGTGRVVWIRSTAKDDLPEGIGLQFSNLSPAVHDRIRNYVVNHRLRAFIPKA